LIYLYDEVLDECDIEHEVGMVPVEFLRRRWYDEVLGLFRKDDSMSLHEQVEEEDDDEMGRMDEPVEQVDEQ